MAIQRRPNWTPILVSDDTRVAHYATVELPFSAFDVTSSADLAKVLDQKSQHRGDIRFALGVALALALPACIGLGVYIAAESIISLIAS
jgi:hypothetical protein